jgi:hypothetical protein
MSANLVLIKAITLLYKEVRIADKIHEQTKELVSKTLDKIALPTVIGSDIDPRTEITEGLIGIARWMLKTDAVQITDEVFKQRLRVVVKTESYLADAVIEVVDKKMTPEESKKICLGLNGELFVFTQEEDARAVFKSLYFDSVNTENKDWSTIVNLAMEKLATFNFTRKEGINHSGFVNMIDFTKKEDIMAAVIRGVEKNSSENVLKTGWQGFNAMLGAPGGFRPGEAALLSARQYNGKSITLLNLFLHFCMYNVPVPRVEGRRPAIVLISLENNVDSNLLVIYKILFEQEFKTECDIAALNVNTETDEGAANLRVITDYVMTKLSEKGYAPIMLRYINTEYSYASFISTMEALLGNGDEIHAVLLDYMATMNKAGCTPGAQGNEIRDLARRIRGYTEPRGITFITAHQLSSDAVQLVRDGRDSLVKAVAGKNYYDDCKRVGQEFDLEIHQDMPVFGTDKYVEWQRGKHRDVNDTPEEHTYCAYRIEKIGFIPPDIDSKAKFTRKLSTMGGSVLERALASV